MRHTLLPFSHPWCKLVLFVLLILFKDHVLVAQQSKRIDGNRNVVTEVRSIQQFASLSVHGSWATVEIISGSMPHLSIETDANILRHIQVSQEGQALSICADGWIEPSFLKIRIQTPYLTQLTLSGWVKLHLKQLDVPRLEIVSEVGHVSVAGKADLLVVAGKKPDLDLTKLAVKRIEGTLIGRAKIVYSGAPILALSAPEATVVSDTAAIEQVQVQRVGLKLYNNRFSTVSLYIEGPSERKFSYGTEIPPYGRKNEFWPIGTKIYLEAKGANLQRGKLLHTVTATDAGQTVRLF